MYKLMFVLVVILAIGCGLVLGTLNADPVALDLLWIQLNWPLGLILVIALALGLCIGLALAWVFQLLPLRLELRRERALNSSAAADASSALSVDDEHP
jgi:putative membrane protein